MLSEAVLFYMGKKITAINGQKKNPNRVSVYLDGEYGFGLAKIVAAWLEVGQELSDEKIEVLLKRDSEEVAFQKALLFLNNRPHSEYEIRQKLTRNGFEEESIQAVIARLQRSGILGDENFARQWIENRTTFRPRGRRLMAMELHQKGVADEIITEALAESPDEVSLAYRVASRYVRRLADLECFEFRKRLTAYLGRRGFSYQTSVEIVERIWGEIQESGDAIHKSENEEIENE